MIFADAALLLASMLALGGLSAFFSAAETALFSLQPLQVEALKTSLPRRAATVDRLFANPRRLLSMILLAGTLSNLPLCVLGLYSLHLYSSWHRAAAYDAPVPFWPAALGLFALVVGVCDLVPKVLALRRPEPVARAAVEALHFLRPLLDPLCGALQAASERLADWMTPHRVKMPLQLTQEEFGALVEVGAEEGALQGPEREMIQEILKLGNKTAKDCMTPRVEAFTLPDDLSNAEAVGRLRAERRHRVPVHGETPDDIVGILDARRFLRRAGGPESGGGAPHYSEYLDPPSYVSETMPAPDLLRSFLTRPQGLAIVVDEYGGTEGIVTLADLVEEVVSDALPTGEEDLYIEELDDARLLVGGHARLDDISEHPGFELAAEGLDTISGLIFNQLGYLPPTGSVLRLAHLKLTIRRVTRTLVTEVMIEKL